MQAKEFEGNKIVISKPKLKTQTVVASTYLGASIDLEKVSGTLKNAIFEPEQFPGLIIRMEEPAGVILLFASGKLVCTAAKEQDIYDAIHKLKEQIATK